MQSMQSMKLSKETCLEFQKDPTRNPTTGRKIKAGGPTFNFLKVQCKHYGFGIHSDAKEKATNANKKTTNANTKEEPEENDNYCAFFIVGLGCSTVDPGELAKDSVSQTKFLKMPFQYMCNISLAKTLYHIAKSVCSLPPSSKNAFVVECINNVKQQLDKGMDVLIVGHSYGGAVANRIFEHFTKYPHSMNEKLHIATFGSIYLSRTTESEIDIRNYMHVHDVALKCNGCKINENKKTCKITWLTNKDKAKVMKKPKRSILGTLAEWEHHNSYASLISSVFNERTVHISANDMGDLTYITV